MAGGRGTLGAASDSEAAPVGGEALVGGGEAGGEGRGAGFGAATGCVSETGVGAGAEAAAGGGAVVGGGAGGAAVACADDRLAARVVFRRPGKAAAGPSARAGRGRGADSAAGASRVGRARGLSSSSRMALPAASEAPNRPAHAAATGSVRRRVMTGVCSCRRWPGVCPGQDRVARRVEGLQVPARPSGGAAAPRHGDLAGPDHLDQAEGPDHLLERLDLVVGAGDLDGHAAP
jgi:hypothetical protein